MSKELIKRDFKLFLETYIPELTGKIRSAFPQTTSLTVPLAIIEIPVSTSQQTIMSGLERTTKYRRLVRLYIIDSSPKKVEQRVDVFCQKYNDNITFFTSCHPFSISSITDNNPLFEEKYGLFVSRIDINVIEFI